MPNAPDLHTHSHFSTYDGMGSPQSVVDRAVELGWGAVCLTEHGHMMSAPALYSAAKKAGIKPIIGSEMYVVPDELLVADDKVTKGTSRHLTVLALTTEGYHNLVAWQNASFERPWYHRKPRISLERMVDLAPWPLHHNVILSGCLGSELCQTILSTNGTALFAAEAYLQAARSIFPNFYIEIQNHWSPKFFEQGFENYDQMVRSQWVVRDILLQLAKDLRLPIVVTNDSHYQRPSQRKAHLAMLASKQWRREQESHEGSVAGQDVASFGAEYVYWMSHLRSMEQIADTLPPWVRKDAIANIQDIVDESRIALDPLDSFTYSIPDSGYSLPISSIRSRCKFRLKRLIARHGSNALDRFEYELDAMGDFAHYLLMVADFIKAAREQGIYTWTRGSAANSLICFCLGIHNIDPIHYNLLFERFVNPARKKLPDIDIDFEDHRRDDVVKIAAEMMERYEGKDNARAICTYGTVANRSAFRLMATSLGIDKEKIDEIANLLPQMIDSGMVTDEAEAYEMLREEFPDLYDLSSEVFDAIATVSQHAAGIVFGTSDRRLSDWVPNYRIGSSDAVVTQYNMKWIEEMGFVKVDFLRLSTLSVMHDIARMVGKDMAWLDSILSDGLGTYGEPDEATYELLRSGETDGVHSFQGGSQRRGCMDVGVENERDCIVVQALYRPSGTRTGFDKQYCNRRHGREEWAIKHPILRANLEETYGLPIFQEQIMAIGRDMGMLGTEIDDLYKAIKTAKGIGRGAAELFENFKPVFLKYAKTCDPPFSDEEAEDTWNLFDAFQGYGFNRGHATSYGILAPKSAYLLAHHPRESLVALLNKYPDNPRYIAAAIKRDYKFEVPDINSGGGNFTRGSTDDRIRVGLARIRGLGPGAVSEVVRNQPFASLDDLRERTNSQRVKVTTVEALARVGALDSIGIGKSSHDDVDVVEFDLLKMVLRKPAAFAGCKPSLPRRNEYSSWKFLGRERGVRITEGKAFVAKLFWIPPIEKLIDRKSSSMGKGSAWLLTVVDENGLPFDLTCYDSDRKQQEVQMLKELANSPGTIICAEGQIGMPFLKDRPTAFKFWGVTGAEDANPQMWHCSEEAANRIMQLAKEKIESRRR